MGHPTEIHLKSKEFNRAKTKGPGRKFKGNAKEVHSENIGRSKEITLKLTEIILNPKEIHWAPKGNQQERSGETQQRPTKIYLKSKGRPQESQRKSARNPFTKCIYEGHHDEIYYGHVQGNH